jgi:hypothetical protein
VAANSEKSNDQGNATNCSGAAAEAIDKKIALLKLLQLRIRKLM